MMALIQAKPLVAAWRHYHPIVTAILSAGTPSPPAA